MKLEGVTVSVDYGDLLAATLPFARSTFDRLVVVTAPHDKLTQRVCEYWHVRCVVTPAFYGEKPGEFYKGRGINVGLEALDRDGWVLHLDSDIYLPPLTRPVLERSALDPEAVYGCDRMMCPSYAAWQEFLACPRLVHEAGVYVHANAFPLGTRLAPDGCGGHVAPGFFQAWNPAASGVHDYPADHGSAARSDVAHALRFKRRLFLPDLVVTHLESAGGLTPMGANWSGRKTPVFGPPHAAARALAGTPADYRFAPRGADATLDGLGY